MTTGAIWSVTFAFAGFDAGVHAAQRWRSFRRWAILLIGLAVFVEIHGVPALRTSYQSDASQGVYVARYWSVFGSRVLSPGDAAPTLPILTLVPLEKPLLSHVREFWHDLVVLKEN